MENWISNIKHFPQAFINSYESIVNNSARNILIDTFKSNQHMMDSSLVKSLEIDKMFLDLPSIANELDEDIEKVLLNIKEQNEDIIHLLKDLIDVVKEYSSRGGFVRSLAQAVLVNIIMCILSFFFRIHSYRPTPFMLIN